MSESRAIARPAKRKTRRAAITPQQRRRIFGLARRRGIDLESVRAMTPAGSVAALSRVEAAGLIRRLGGVVDADGGAGGRTRSAATAAQLGMIEHLAAIVGFTPNQLRAWMRRQWGVESIEDGAGARKIIAALRSIQRHRAGLPS